MSDLRSRVAQSAHPDQEPQPVDPRRVVDVPLPDVTDSGIVADPKASVFAAWTRVMEEVEFVKKDSLRADSGGRYNFRGIDAVLKAVGPALRKHGVIVMPTGIDPTYAVISSAKGNPMNYCRAVVRFTIFGPNGDAFPLPGEVVGEAFDTGDKASTKAQSVALRTFLINALAIPTAEPERDTEYGVQHELGAAKPPTPDEYLGELLSERTSLGRLYQIRDEFKAHPDIAATVVSLLDGEEIALSKLLTRVGNARAEAARVGGGGGVPQ